MPEAAIKEKRTDTYEEIYYALWEMTQRYQEFCQFRVIGSSHDERMIPMIEVGKGKDVIFCVSGIDGTQRQMPELLTDMAAEYCGAYECNWNLGEFYEVRKLLNKIRLCMIPVLNPDGYEISQKGFSAIRNPIFRQMLRMQSIPWEDFGYNARGMDICHNFPTLHYTRSRMGDEPASENETRALMRMIQEYGGKGLLTFGQSGREIIYYHSEQGFGGLPKAYCLARHLQKMSSYRIERKHGPFPGNQKFKGMGTPEQYYMQTAKQPAFRIRVPSVTGSGKTGCESWKKTYEEIHLLPLEYLFSLENTL